MAVLSKTIGVQVLEALGLPSSKWMSLRLDFAADSIVTAHAEYAPSVAELEQVIEIVKRLRSVEA